MCGANPAVLAGILRHHIYEHLHPHVSWQRPFVEHVLSMRQMFFSKTEVSHSRMVILYVYAKTGSLL